MQTDREQRDSARDALDRTWSDCMRAAQKGDADAYRSLLVAIQPHVRALVRARIHEPVAAEDVVQNALLSIHRGRATYRPERSFGPWMRAIVRNSVIDHFRERKRRADREADVEIEDWPDERRPDDAPHEGLAPELMAALETLPPAQREAVTLVQLNGLSIAEAALRAGISPGALKVRAHRGYRAMRKVLEGSRERGEWLSETPPPAKKTPTRGAG